MQSAVTGVVIGGFNNLAVGNYSINVGNRWINFTPFILPHKDRRGFGLTELPIRLSKLIISSTAVNGIGNYAVFSYPTGRRYVWWPAWFRQGMAPRYTAGTYYYQWVYPTGQQVTDQRLVNVNVPY
ncbi:unnamed protein product [Gongylonema pulchrum]|uniref:Ntox23 domain-containing protein n=1 Tax=Gongylonema pulchrum TaxID=637853 RepID=A0A183DXL5_9BILA|nr:unnamed protein product [Gongylonema pulchrum]